MNRSDIPFQIICCVVVKGFRSPEEGLRLPPGVQPEHVLHLRRGDRARAICFDGDCFQDHPRDTTSRAASIRPISSGMSMAMVIANLLFVSQLHAGLNLFFTEALTASGLDAICEFLDIALVVVGKFSTLDGFKSRANISAERLNTLVAFTKHI